MKKKILFALGAVVVLGLGLWGVHLYRSTHPSTADHRVLSLSSDEATASSVALNLRLLQSARALSSDKAALEQAEKALLQVGSVPARHRELFLETFSSLASGSMTTEEGMKPFRVFASRGPAEEALRVLEGHKLLASTSGEDYVFIDPETCAREEPLRLVKGERLLAFVPASHAARVSARLAQPPGLEMEPLLIGRADIRVRPYLESLAPELVRMIAEQQELEKHAQRLALSLRADKNGGLWAELDVAGDGVKQLEAAWVELTGKDAQLKEALAQAVTLQPSAGMLRFTVDVNVLRQSAARLGESLSLGSKPLTLEDLKDITEEAVVLEPEEVFPYGEAMTPESFFTASAEGCELRDGTPVADNDKLRLAFEVLSSRPSQPDVDFVSLSARACLPPNYIPVMPWQPMLEVAIQEPAPDRPSCGRLSLEKNGIASKQSLQDNQSSGNELRTSVEFALPPGVDLQKAKALTGTVTLRIPTRVQKLKLDFRAPYARTALTLPQGTLWVEGTQAHRRGLTFKLSSEGALPLVLAVRALDADGRYLQVEDSAVQGSFTFELPFLEWFQPRRKEHSLLAYGQPTQLEVVLEEASTPLTHPFTLTPPLPVAERPEDGAVGEPPPVEGLTRARYEQIYLTPEALARQEERFTQTLGTTSFQSESVGSRLPMNAPFKLRLWRPGQMHEGHLGIIWHRTLGSVLRETNAKLALEIQEADFADGTRLRPADIEQVVEDEDGDKRYVWGRFGSRPVTWRTELSLDRVNLGTDDLQGILFSEYIPERLEDVPVVRVKGQLSLTLPEALAMSPAVPMSLHTPIELEGTRFRIVRITPERVSVLSESPGKNDVWPLFIAGGEYVSATLKEREDFSDAVQFDFETASPARAWRMLQAQGDSKTYAYPFELVVPGVKPAPRQAKN